MVSNKSQLKPRALDFQINFYFLKHDHFHKTIFVLTQAHNHIAWMILQLFPNYSSMIFFGIFLFLRKFLCIVFDFHNSSSRFIIFNINAYMDLHII